LNKIEL